MENLGEFIVNHWILSSLFVVLLWLVFSDSLTRKLSGFNTVDVPAAVQLVNQQKGRFVDVREKAAFEKGHIVDAVNVPLAEIDTNLSPLKKTDQPIILVCDSGQRAKSAVKQFKTRGYTNIHVLSGGIHAWQDAKLPLFS